MSDTDAGQLLKDTFNSWESDKVLRLGAALSYYTVFSLPPLLVLIIGIAAIVFGEEAARGQIIQQFRGLIGEEGAKGVQTMIEKAGGKEGGIIATTVSSIVLLLGATGVFIQLQDALNSIWGVKPKPIRVAHRIGPLCNSN